MLIVLGAIAQKKSLKEGGKTASGPGPAAGVTPQVPMGAPRTPVAPRRLPVGLINRPGRTVKRPVARRQAPMARRSVPARRTPAQKRTSLLRAPFEKSSGAGEASAEGGGSDGEEGGDDGQGNDEGGGNGDAEMEVDMEHAFVKLNEQGECKRIPDFWAPPAELPTGGSVYLERLQKAIQEGFQQKRNTADLANIGPNVFLQPRKVKGRLMDARWAQMRWSSSSCTWTATTSASSRAKCPITLPRQPQGRRSATTWHATGASR
jgi:hypothetical protein